MKNKPKKTQKSYLYIIFLVLAFIILLGTYAYPNKYGVPCDFVTVSSFPDYEPRFESSETINFTL